MEMKFYAQATLLTYRLLLMLNFSVGDEPPAGGGGFGGYDIFGEGFFTGKSLSQVALEVTNIALKVFLLLGVLFFAWKFASAGLDYFSADEYSLHARSNKRTLFFELMEPVKGLALLLLLGAILTMVFDHFLESFGSSTTFQITDPSSVVTGN